MTEILYKQLSKIRDADKEGYRRILSEWEKSNLVLQDVVAKRTTFSDEVERITNLAGPKWRTEWYESKTPRDKDLEVCVGPFKKLDFWYDVGLGASVTAAIATLMGLFTGANIAKKNPDELTDNEKQLITSVESTASQPIMTRKDFVYAFAFKSAAVFGIFGGIGGCAKNLYDKSVYRARAEFLDSKINELYQ